MEGLAALVALIMVLVLRSRLSRATDTIEKLALRVNALENRTEALSERLRRATITREDPAQPEPAQPKAQAPQPAPQERPVSTPPPRAAATAQGSTLSRREDPRGTSFGRSFAEWLFGGNTVVRVGIVILFFGIAFFFNYAVEQDWLPIEVRLVLAVLGGLALMAVGWGLRDKRRDYALVLQGGGVGIVYLTVFAGVNLYGLLPAAYGLGMMLVIVALSSGLAVLQDARSLAVLATLGGFLAPVLVSRSGSHVALFSYYTVLDAGVFAIAWFKSWPVLDRLGFVGTFIIATAWGVLSYTPEQFSSTEPFLIAFFLLYVAIPVLDAVRDRHDEHQPDAMLLFGVPLVAFGLQAGLVRNFEYGLAISAVAAAIFYLGLASALRHRLAGSARMLIDIFIALGITFGTVAIPLALDGRWSASAWALEGAALIWIGVRQRRELARLAGLVLQVAAGVLMFMQIDAPVRDVPILNGAYLGALLVAAAGLFSAWYLYRHPEIEGWRDVSPSVLVWGLVWWCGAGLREIAVHVPGANQLPASLMFAAGTAALLAVLRFTLAWRHLSVPVLLLLPLMAIAATGSFDTGTHPFARWWGVAWILAMTTHCWIQWRLESEWREFFRGPWHQGMLWLVVFLASWETWWAIDRLAGVSIWSVAGWILVPAAAIAAVPVLIRMVEWPFRRFSRDYSDALIPVAVVAAAWVLFTSADVGDPSPLPYVLLANPLELAQCLVLVVLLRWSRRAPRVELRRTAWYVWCLLAFAVLNGMIARATHFYVGVEFDLTSLWSSARYQAAVSIVWTAVALAAMLTASWLKSRTVWFSGAAVLAAVVLKLSIVDLVDVNTVARIVSFVAVGVLMLLVGYLSPLPPRLTEQN